LAGKWTPLPIPLLSAPRTEASFSFSKVGLSGIVESLARRGGVQVAQYVRTYLGNSSETMTFVQQYLQKREIWRQQNKMLQVLLTLHVNLYKHITDL